VTRKQADAELLRKESTFGHDYEIRRRPSTKADRSSESMIDCDGYVYAVRRSDGRGTLAGDRFLEWEKV
jgi:hypothetical protein